MSAELLLYVCLAGMCGRSAGYPERGSSCGLSFHSPTWLTTVSCTQSMECASLSRTWNMLCVKREMQTAKNSFYYQVRNIIIIIKRISSRRKSCKTSGPLCVPCDTSVSGAVAGSVRCHMIYRTVPSSVRTWMPPVTTVMWSQVAACSRLLLRQRGSLKVSLLCKRDS